MKQLFLKSLHGFYSYYSTGSTKDVAYLSVFCALSGIVMLNSMAILSMLGLLFKIPLPSGIEKWQQYLIAIPIILFIYYIFTLIIPEKTVKEVVVTDKELKLIGYINIFIILISFIFFSYSVFNQPHLK